MGRETPVYVVARIQVACTADGRMWFDRHNLVDLLRAGELASCAPGSSRRPSNLLRAGGSMRRHGGGITYR